MIYPVLFFLSKENPTDIKECKYCKHKFERRDYKAHKVHISMIYLQ